MVMPERSEADVGPSPGLAERNGVFGQASEERPGPIPTSILRAPVPDGEYVFAADRERGAVAGEEEPSPFEPGDSPIRTARPAVMHDQDLDQADVEILGSIEKGEVASLSLGPLRRRKTYATLDQDEVEDQEPEAEREQKGESGGAEHIEDQSENRGS